MRSGSTFLFRLLRDYSDDYASDLNEEFFNTLHPGWSAEDTGTHLINSKREYLPLDDEVNYRINLLKKYNCKYTLKILSTHLTPTILEFVSDNYNIIVIDRKNKYEQYLSYIIAFYTDIWNFDSYNERYITPFECPEEYAFNFFKIESKWQTDKKYILETLSPLVFTYEDLVMDPTGYLQSHGITTRPHSSYYKEIHKLNIKNTKPECIINIQKINEIYLQNKHIWDLQ